MEWWIKLPDGSYSVSDIQDYIKYILKKHETSVTTTSSHVYINRTNNRLVFEIKDGTRLELQTPETMELLAAQKSL